MAKISNEKATDFFKACKSGDIATARDLVRDVNQSSLKEWRTPEDRTCLHGAVVAGSPDILRELAAKLPELIKMTDNQGNTALHLAVSICRVELMKQLVDLDATLCDCKNKKQEIPLNMAIRLQFLEAVEFLMPRTKSALEEENKFLLHRAVSFNQAKLIEILIRFSKEGKLDLSKLINLAYEPATNTQTKNCDASPSEIEGNRVARAHHIQAIDGNTSLKIGVKNIYEHFIEEEKRPRQPIVRGDTPLHIAARNKYERMVDLLLKVDGVSKHALNEEYNTPVDVAREVMEYHESFRIIRKLGDFKRRSKPFMYCAPKITDDKHKRAMDLVNESYKGRRNTELVVAALLATMTFTAAFTVPGGFQTDTKQKDELGSPVLISFTPFRLFLTFNFIAFFLALFACIMWQMTSELTVGDKLLFMTINSGVVCCSFGFTAYGFVAALYTVLEHKVNFFSWVVLANLILLVLCGILAVIYQSARFLVSRARFLRLCGAPYLIDDFVEWVWNKFERQGFLDILRYSGDKIRNTVTGQFKLCGTSTLCGTGHDLRAQNNSRQSV